MNKQEFIALLREKLEGLPVSEVKKSVDYFSEMIDDRLEEGMTEEEAVAEMEEIDEIVKKVTYDIPLPTLMKEKLKKKGSLSTLNIVLLIIGFPIWAPLLIACLAVVGSFFIAIFAILISIIIGVIALIVGGIISIILSPFRLMFGIANALVNFGIGAIIVGLGILLINPLKDVAKTLIEVAKWGVVKIKSLFITKNGGM
jgi:Predicted membrane protein